jgi:DNA-binding NarL/FixJ family response regulator
MVQLPQHPIKVVIADAHPIMRAGLATVIETEPLMRVVAAAAHGHDLIHHLDTRASHVLVIDLAALGDRPVALLRKLRRTYPQLGIVVFCPTADLDFTPEVLAAGADACVSKAESDDHLRLAICAARAGQRYLSPLAQSYVDQCVAPTQPTADDRLAPREREALAYVVRGLENLDIADRMGVALRTVENYMTAIHKKTGCTTLAQMRVWYHRMYGANGAESASWLDSAHPAVGRQRVG